MLSIAPCLPLQPRSTFGQNPSVVNKATIIESVPVTEHVSMSSPPQSAHPQNVGPVLGFFGLALVLVIARDAILALGKSKKPK
jgi:hypothetical protein